MNHFEFGRVAWGKRLGLGAAAFLLLGGVGVVMVRSGPMAPVKVTVAQVSTGRVSPAVMGIGTVEARRAWMVGPTAAGRVQRVAVDVGDTVAPGQLLAEMDPVDLDQRLAGLDASLARARSAVAAAQAQVQDATARQQLSASTLRRNEDLARQQFISTGGLESRQQELASATAALQASRENAKAAEHDLARLNAERAGLVQQRGNVRLLAPAQGVVTTREAEPGTTVVAGQAVLRLVDPASLWIKTRIDQGRSAGLATGQPAQIVLRSQPAQTLPGTVARLELLADAVTEERLVQVAFATPPKGVSVGEMAEVTVQLPASTEGLRVPNAALQRQAGANGQNGQTGQSGQATQTGVWRLDADDKPAWVPVQVVASGLDGWVRIQAPNSTDLASGDRVVQHSQKPVRAGMRLKVVDALVPGTAP